MREFEFSSTQIHPAYMEFFGKIPRKFRERRGKPECAFSAHFGGDGPAPQVYTSITIWWDNFICDATRAIIELHIITVLKPI